MNEGRIGNRMRKSVRWLAGVLFVSWLVSGSVATADSVIGNPNFDNDIDSGTNQWLDGSGNLTGAWSNPDGTHSFLKGYRAGADGVVEDVEGATVYVPTSQPGGGTTGLMNGNDSYQQHLTQTVSLTAGAWTLSFALASTFQNADFTTMATDLENGVLMLSLAVYQGSGTSGNVVWSLSGGGAANLVSIANLVPTDATWNTEERTFKIAEDGQYTLEIRMKGDNTIYSSYLLTNVQLAEAVPEPGTWAMLCGLGLIGGVWYRRRIR